VEGWDLIDGGEDSNEYALRVLEGSRAQGAPRACLHYDEVVGNISVAVSDGRWANVEMVRTRR
jgi:hypothetical protein